MAPIPADRVDDAGAPLDTPAVSTVPAAGHSRCLQARGVRAPACSSQSPRPLRGSDPARGPAPVERRPGSWSAPGRAGSTGGRIRSPMADARRSTGARAPGSGRRWFRAPEGRVGASGGRSSESPQPRMSSRRSRPADPVTRPVGCGGPVPATRSRRSRATQPKGLCSPTRAGRSRSLSGKTGPTGQLLRSPPPCDCARLSRDARAGAAPIVAPSRR